MHEKMQQTSKQSKTFKNIIFHVNKMLACAGRRTKHYFDLVIKH